MKVADVVRALSNYNTDPTFLQALKEAEIAEKNTSKDFITLFGSAFSRIDPNAQLSTIFNTVELKERITYNSTNEEVLEVIKEESKSAIDNAFNILRTRIDRFGVTQPNIQKLEKAGRVLVELPGVTDPQRVRKLLQGTASLEFWETYEHADLFQSFVVITSYSIHYTKLYEQIRRGCRKRRNRRRFSGRRVDFFAAGHRF